MGDTRRIRLHISYDGTGYAGWQRQVNALSVQQRVEEAVCKLTGEGVCVQGASRTDAGVHALCQVAFFDTASRIPAEKFCYALNTCLPPDIRVIVSQAADGDFHARYHAKGKVYRYFIHNHRHASALYRNYRAHVALPLDASLMHREAQAMCGTQDFRAFAASGSVAKETVRTVRRVQVTRHGDLVALIVYGDGFLYNMVRILAGTLADVGMGRILPGAIRRGIDTGDRLALGVTAPAQGLTLMRVLYEGEEAQADGLFLPDGYLI